MSEPDDKLRRAIADLLGAAPLPRAVIVDALVQRGVDLGTGGPRHRFDRLLQEDTSFAEVAGGVFHVPSVVEGTSWTVWVDPDDARDGFVRTHPHLSPLSWWLIGDDVPLVNDAGQVVGAFETDGWILDGRDTDVVIGPDGWLDDLVGGWATVTVTDGGLRWSRCQSPPDPTDAQIAAMRAGFDRAVRTESVEMYEEEEGPVGLRFATGDNPIHEALLADRAAFLDAPIPPLPELYRAAGLVEQGRIIAEEGFDWAALRSWQNRHRLELVHGLDGEQVERLVVLLGAYTSFVAESVDGLGGDDGEQEGAAILLTTLLEGGAVAEAFWAECASDGDAVSDVGRFVDELAAHLVGFMPAGLAWLRARCLDRSGETAAAVATLEEAVTADCDHRPALLELAGFAADRGDAPTAYRLLQRMGVTERAHDDGDEPDEADHLLAEVEGFALHRPRQVAKRNDPCPCGSGRKYKACHLGRERHELDDRAGWLYLKAQRFLRQHEPDDVAMLAEEMADSIDMPGAYRQVLHSPVVMDLALHGDVFTAFLAARDGLLPDDEALLAAQWALVDHGVFEVQRVGGDRLELRDIGRGERITVANVHSSTRTRRGTVLFGRPLPVGDAYRAYSGFMEVPRALVADLQGAIDDGDALDIAAVLGRVLRPPRLSNTDGDDLVFHTLRWRITDPTAIDGALRSAGMESHAEAEWRLARDSANMANATIATLRLEDDELVGEVNSNERADELRELVVAAVPDAELVADDTRPFDEALEDFDPDDAPPLLDQNDPAIRQVLEQFIVEQERRWLDEPIPALGGSTPREAAADPIGREELVQLLDSFRGPTPDNPGTFDPDRLRRALGL